MTHTCNKMLIRTKLASICQSGYCAQVSKKILRVLRFSSTQSNIKSSSRKNHSELGKVETGVKKAPTRKRLQGNAIRAEKALIPPKYQFVRIRDGATASAIAKRVEDLFDKDNNILEFDAGPGLLSTALLKSGIIKLVAFEPLTKFHSKLEKIEDNNKELFKFFPLWMDEFMLFSDQQLSEELQGLVNYQEGSSVQIVAPVYSWELLINIARRMRDIQSFLMSKSVNLCLILPESSWNEFLDLKRPKKCVEERILFMLSFDYQILGKFQSVHFHIDGQRKKKEVDLKCDVVLLQVKSRQEERFDYTEMQVFLSQFYNHQSRNRLVIPSLEQWSPSCGEELVKRGIPVFARFSDLTPEVLLEVFLYFKSLPNVEASDFFLEGRDQEEERDR